MGVVKGSISHETEWESNCCGAIVLSLGSLLLFSCASILLVVRIACCFLRGSNRQSPKGA